MYKHNAFSFRALLFHNIKCRVKYKVQADSRYGGQLPNGTWDGTVGAVQRMVGSVNVKVEVLYHFNVGLDAYM